MAGFSALHAARTKSWHGSLAIEARSLFGIEDRIQRLTEDRRFYTSDSGKPPIK
jgi:hypothetical protein